MHYVKYFNVLGVDAAQIPCIELQGIPTTATEGAVGVLGVNMASADHEIYICVGVNGTVYTWIPLKGDGGVTISKAEVNEIGELIITLSNSAEINAGVVAGSGCFVNGVATDVNFTANPQDQIDGCVKKAGDTVEGQLLLPNSPTTPDEGTVTNAYTTRKTANSDITGLEVVDGSVTHIREIKGSTVTSKNLFNAAIGVSNLNNTINKIIINNANSITLEVNGDKPYSGAAMWNKKLNAGTYTVSYLATITNTPDLSNTSYNRFYVFLNGVYYNSTNMGGNQTKKRHTLKIVVPNDDTTVSLRWYVTTENGTTYNNYSATYENIMLEEGENATEYEPYVEGLKHANINSIVSTGKNLFDIANIEKGSAGDFTVDGNNVLFNPKTLKSDFFAFGYWVNVKPNTEYYFSCTSKSIPTVYLYTDSYFGNLIAYGELNKPINVGNNSKILVGFYTRGTLRDGEIETISDISISKEKLTSYEPYIEPNIYQLPKTVELAAFDKLLPQEGKLVKQTGYATSATGFTDEQIASYDSAIVSSDKKSLVYKLPTTQETKMDIPKNYTVYHGGTETIVQGDVDNSQYGAIPTITQTYSIHENPKEVAIKEYVNNALAKKLDKTGGTITGNLVVEGKTDTALGAVISKQGDVIYGLAYENEAYKLGQGTIDENGDFAFNEGEGLPIALRDDSTKFVDGHIVKWDAEKNKLVDGDAKLSEYAKKSELFGTGYLLYQYSVRLTHKSLDKTGRVIVCFSFLSTNGAIYTKQDVVNEIGGTIVSEPQNEYMMVHPFIPATGIVSGYQVTHIAYDLAKTDDIDNPKLDIYTVNGNVGTAETISVEDLDFDICKVEVCT